MFLDNKRIPIEDLEALNDIVLNDRWPLVAKYLSKLADFEKNRLIEAKPEENLTYLKGRVDGALQIARMIDDFKPYIKKRYLNL